jgi:L-methionine (R)-S-oxide reductase
MVEHEQKVDISPTANSLAYKGITEELTQFFQKYNDKGNKLSLVAKMASICASIKNHCKDFGFVGYYIVVDLLDSEGKKLEPAETRLEIGPYLSSFVATPRIGFGNGVCGTAWKEKTVQVVNDVSLCKNYIACDSETNSEVVIPIFDQKDGSNVVAVLDIDSNFKNRFSEEDRAALERISDLIYS